MNISKKTFSILDFDFPFRDDWLAFHARHPLPQLAGDPFTGLTLNDWLHLCCHMIQESLGSITANRRYANGAAFIYGACLCRLFNGRWVTDESRNITLASIEYRSFGTQCYLANPYLKIQSLDNIPYSERFPRLLVLDCFYEQIYKTPEFPCGHPLFYYNDDPNGCPISMRAKAILADAGVDAYDLLRIATKMEIDGFDVDICSREIEINLQCYMSKMGP